MIPDLLDSIFRPAAYRRFSAENAARTASYIAFLSLIFVGGLGIAVKLRLAPMFSETFAWLETSMPPLTFGAGGATSPLTGPVRLEHPRMKEIALIVDTARKEPVTARQLSDAKVIAYLTGNALYLSRGPEQVETVDLTKSAPERSVTVDAAMYKDMARAFDWVFYPGLMLFFFLVFALTLAVCGLAYALVGLVLARLAGGSLGYGALFRIAVHAQTAGSLLYALDAALPWALPYFQFVSAAGSLAFLWLGVQGRLEGRARGARRPRRMRRALALALAAAALGGCELLTGNFSLSGTVDVAPRLRERAPKTNAMLFVVAENEGGVPVAVHRIVNPEFPAAFTMGSEDLLVPAVRRRESLRVHVEMNTHGDIGRPQSGDLEGDAASSAAPGDAGIQVVLDRVR